MNLNKKELNWIEIERDYGNILELDKNYKKYEKKIDGLKDIKLYPHQLTILESMIELEKIQKIKIKKESYTKYENKNIKEIYLKSRKGILSEKFGSGKTIIILSLILSTKKEKIEKKIEEERKKNIIIKKEYNKIINTNIIIVSNSVYKQWIKNIEEKTNLKIYKISNILELNKFQELLKTKIETKEDQIDIGYDIILIKSGKTTVQNIKISELELEDINKKYTNYIVNILSNMCRNYYFKRFIIDDFDLITLSKDFGHINSNFTWYISATNKLKKFIYSYNKEYEMNKIIKNTYNNINSINTDKNLQTYFNIRNTTEYIEESIKTCCPKFYLYNYKNPDKNYVNIIGKLLDNENSTEIMEMLNSNSYESVAEIIKSKGSNICDIFEKLLGEKYNDYIFSKNILNHIEKYINNIDKIEKIITFNEYLENKEITKEEYKKLKIEKQIKLNNKYKKQYEYNEKSLKKLEPINYKYKNIEELLKKNKEYYKEIYKNSSNIINRLKNNINENTCCICYNEFNDINTVIFKCCNIVLCENCAIRATYINNNKNNNIISGKCPYCRTIIGLKKDMIFINKELNLIEKINNNQTIKKELDNEYIIKKEENDIEIKTKFDTIIDIISNNINSNFYKTFRKNININIPSLIIGNKIYKDSEIKKILIFSNHNEQINKIYNLLTDTKIITFNKLNGHFSNINNLVNLYNEDNNKLNCLLINSSNISSGLNLQNTTDLIFTHHIMNINILSQVMGRVCRIGRKYAINIHFLYYENEKINDIIL